MSIVPDPPLSAYAPYFRAGVVAVVCQTVDGEPVFGQAAAAELLRRVWAEMRAPISFELLGWAILPSRVHLLIRPRAGSRPLPLVRHLQRRYEQAWAQLMGMPGPLVVWAPAISLQRVQDLPDFARILDGIHYAAVAAGLVTRPEDWPHSSYAIWVERRLYKLGWGWARPERLRSRGPGSHAGSGTARGGRDVG